MGYPVPCIYWSIRGNVEGYWNFGQIEPPSFGRFDLRNPNIRVQYLVLIASTLLIAHNNIFPVPVQYRTFRQSFFHLRWALSAQRGRTRPKTDQKKNKKLWTNPGGDSRGFFGENQWIKSGLALVLPFQTRNLPDPTLIRVILILNLTRYSFTTFAWFYLIQTRRG